MNVERCVGVQREMERLGGVIVDSEPVQRVTADDADHVTVSTTRTIYRARSVVVAAGPWTSRLTQPLGLRLPLQVRLHASSLGYR